MSGDHTLFTSAEGIERLWERSKPLLENPPPVRPYPPGRGDRTRSTSSSRPTRGASRSNGPGASRDRRRRRLAARRSVRPVRHGPRGVHRRALSGLRVRSRATSRSGSSNRSDRRPPLAGACKRVIGSRSRCSCRAANATRAGRAYQRCERHGLADMYGYRERRSRPGLWGGYAQYQYLAPDSMLCPVPDTLDAVTATMFNPLGAGIRWGVTMPGTRRRCRRGARPGRARLVGLRGGEARGRRVRDGDRSRRARRPRLGVASQFGADLAVDVDTVDPVRALRDATGGLADVVVDVTAKAPAAFAQAIKLARPGGTVVVAGTRGAGALARSSIPIRSSTRSCACSARWASIPPRTPRRSSCSRRGASRSRRSRAGRRSRRRRRPACGDGGRGRGPTGARGGRARAERLCA